MKTPESPKPFTIPKAKLPDTRIPRAKLSQTEANVIEDKAEGAPIPKPRTSFLVDKAAKKMIEEREEELKTLRAQKLVTDNITEDKLLPVEELLRRKTARPLSEFPKYDVKKGGISSGYEGKTTLSDIKRQQLPDIKISTPVTKIHMVKQAEMEAFYNPELVLSPDYVASSSGLHPIENASATIREYIAAPLYNLLLPGRSPNIGIIQQNQGKNYINSEFLSEFQTVADSLRKGAHSTVSGFESVVVASMLLGEVDPNAANLGVMQDKNGNKMAKIDHGYSLVNFPKTKEGLKHDLHTIFFLPDARPYNELIQNKKFTFDKSNLISAINNACQSLNENTLRDTISNRINDLEKHGINFEVVLGYSVYCDSSPVLDMCNGKITDPPRTKNELIDFYVNNILKQKEIMMDLARDLKKLPAKEPVLEWLKRENVREEERQLQERNREQVLQWEEDQRNKGANRPLEQAPVQSTTSIFNRAIEKAQQFMQKIWYAISGNAPSNKSHYSKPVMPNISSNDRAHTNMQYVALAEVRYNAKPPHNRPKENIKNAASHDSGIASANTTLNSQNWSNKVSGRSQGKIDKVISR